MKNEKKKIIPSLSSLQPYLSLTAAGLVAGLTIYRGEGPDQLAGGFLVVTLLFFIFYRDINRYQPQYLQKKRMLLLLGILLAGILGASRLAEYLLHGLSVGLELDAIDSSVYGIPIPAGAMLVTLLFDFHTAIFFSFVVSLIAGLWQGDPTFAVYGFVGSVTAAFSMIHCKKRTAILRGGLYLLGANLLTLMTLLLLRGDLVSPFAGLAMVFSTIQVIFVIAIVSLSLPMFEYLFKVTTDISLLELLDLNHPLMKHLMISAPGTYHHSIIVGNLVESSGEDVGVNPLMARVGAYYHDIGKVKMPEYFIENQTSGMSRHEKLTPHMSSMILTSHVKEGVDLADQYKLPEEVKDFIQQHHGTALIKYFYEKAKGLENGTETPAEEYKYPGPRPQSRVAALIMMADAVEAASRVLHDPTPARIAALVDKIINHIFLAGQLDECELTLKDITVIKNKFTRILTGILHKRIDYPGFDFGKKEKEGEGPDQQSPAESKDQHAADREGYRGGFQIAESGKGRA
jgi:putative nucleotidyltransferase with HDIG domain